jgi:23S rRNA (cytosine1962-C5)-methyltransferase
LSYEPIEINYGFFYDRIKQAWNYRKMFADPMSCRVVFAESDFIPALIVDKFANYLSIQTLSLGIEQFKEQIIDILTDIIKPDGIYERNDVGVRELEGLNQVKGFIGKEFDTQVLMEENGVKFMVDMENGQKTGFFLDQKENRAALKPFVKNKKVLDCFTHTGSFALHAGLYGAKSVVGIDISEHAVNCSIANAKLNNLQEICTFKEENTFDILREYNFAKENFDTIILDPPAFTKSKDTVDGAIRGYKDINLRAMKLINNGGFLISCSCSHHVKEEMFMGIMHQAAIDAKRTVRVVEKRTQALDHPILLASPETRYLKCVIMQVFT